MMQPGIPPHMHWRPPVREADIVKHVVYKTPLGRLCRLVGAGLLKTRGDLRWYAFRYVDGDDGFSAAASGDGFHLLGANVGILRVER